MTHEDLAEKVRKAMGGRVPLDARETFGNFRKQQATEIRLLYDWIKDARFYRWIYENPEVDFGEGNDRILVWITRFGRVGHQS